MLQWRRQHRIVNRTGSGTNLTFDCREVQTSDVLTATSGMVENELDAMKTKGVFELVAQDEMPKNKKALEIM